MPRASAQYIKPWSVFDDNYYDNINRVANDIAWLGGLQSGPHAKEFDTLFGNFELRKGNKDDRDYILRFIKEYQQTPKDNVIKRALEESNGNSTLTAAKLLAQG